MAIHLHKLFTRRTYVKPVSLAPNTQWMVIENTTMFREFFDDIRRYGWRVAMYNITHDNSERIEASNER